jgi:hypothetical protein
LRTSDLIGRRITLRNQGEGWFPGYTEIGATIDAFIPSNDGGNPYYVVRFEPPVTPQESGLPTPSGLTRKAYSRAVIRCRWRGYDLGTDTIVSVHLLLVEPGQEPPTSAEQVLGLPMVTWASCEVARGPG